MSLSENPTTGYRWELEDIRGLEMVGDRFQSSGGSIGAAGNRIFQFRGIDVGKHELRLKNWRKWEGDSSVINRFSATIFVK